MPESPPSWRARVPRPGRNPGVLFNHYSLLLTTEQLLGLRALGQAAYATSMLSAFNL